VSEEAYLEITKKLNACIRHQLYKRVREKARGGSSEGQSRHLSKKEMVQALKDIDVWSLRG